MALLTAEPSAVQCAMQPMSKSHRVATVGGLLCPDVGRHPRCGVRILQHAGGPVQLHSSKADSAAARQNDLHTAMDPDVICCGVRQLQHARSSVQLHSNVHFSSRAHNKLFTSLQGPGVGRRSVCIIQLHSKSGSAADAHQALGIAHSQDTRGTACVQELAEPKP